VLHDLPTSMRIAGWAYQQTFEAGGLAWVKKEEMVPIPADWQPTPSGSCQSAR
jgi:hypothetical protein